MSATPPEDIRIWFHSFEQWRDFVRHAPDVTDPAIIDGIVDFGLRNGVNLRLLGRIPPAEAERRGANYREDFWAAGFNPRQRAMLETFIEHPMAGDINDVRIWGHEGLTPFALFLRARYPKYVGTEYAATPAIRERLFPIPVVDVTQAPWPAESFDIVLSGDVFEHVSDLDAALRECARVLRVGGRMVASFPFDYRIAATDVRATIEDGVVRHHAPPEYHGNPADPEGGSLVFQVPGWDIVERCLAAGFSRASMQFWSSHVSGLVSAELSGIFLLDAWR